jgi:uncharacterized protein YacL
MPIRYLKSLALISIFLTVAAATFYFFDTIAPSWGLSASWSQEFNYLISVIAALLIVLSANRIGRQLYIHSRQLIIKLSLSDFIIGLIGGIVGLLLAALATVPLAGLPDPWSWISSLIVAILATTAAIWAFTLKRNTIIEWFDAINFLSPHRSKERDKLRKNELSQEKDLVNPMVLDTSAIIDGRIGDIVKSGFLFGTLVVPIFILHELQQVADSTNPEKRQRGRRGIKLLQSLKKNKKIDTLTLDVDYEEVPQVDQKLIVLAKELKAKIVTCDYNLNGIAKVQGVTILNVNELATYLRQQFMPGELISVRVVQAGKENGQGIGYLPDGTMVVIQDAARLIGREVVTEVERVLQTAAGRMVFVKYSAPTRAKRLPLEVLE